MWDKQWPHLGGVVMIETGAATATSEYTLTFGILDDRQAISTRST